MNDQLKTYARTTLKKGLAQCNEAQQTLFKRMYSHDNLEASIDDVVDNVPLDRLDHAMQQVERTLSKANPATAPQ